SGGRLRPRRRSPAVRGGLGLGAGTLCPGAWGQIRRGGTASDDGDERARVVALSPRGRGSTGRPRPDQPRRRRTDCQGVPARVAPAARCRGGGAASGGQVPARSRVFV